MHKIIHANVFSPEPGREAFTYTCSCNLQETGSGGWVAMMQAHCKHRERAGVSPLSDVIAMGDDVDSRTVGSLPGFPCGWPQPVIEGDTIRWTMGACNIVMDAEEAQGIARMLVMLGDSIIKRQETKR